MDETYVFHKTPKGSDIGAHAASLSARHLRCLIMIDGKKNVRGLAPFFRPGELAALLRELVEQGFVQPPPDGIAAIEHSLAKIQFIDEAKFLDLQTRAMQEINDRLGPPGIAIAKQIGACARPEQLRIALRSLEKIIQNLAGEAYAKEFVKRIGQELMGSGS